MSRQLTTVAALIILLIAGAFALAGRSTLALRPELLQETRAPVAATLDDFRWLVGDWRGTRPDGAVVEESWREPIGDAMLGTFRWVADGKTRFYEILVIEQDETGPVLRLKHFNPGLTGWEEKDECLSWRLVEVNDSRALFRRGEKEGSGELVMERRGEDGLYIGVDVIRDGEKGVLAFDFTRYRP